MYGRVWVEKVFRGRSFGEFELSTIAYKNYYKLVPKDEEESYIKKTLAAEEVDKIRKPIPEFIDFPPLLKVCIPYFTNCSAPNVGINPILQLQEMIKREEKTEDPVLRAVYKLGPDNLVRISPGMVNRSTLTEGTKAHRLYANLKPLD